MSTDLGFLLAVATLLSRPVCEGFQMPNHYQPSTTGDTCQVRLTGETGTCRLLGDCPQVAANLFRSLPTICGFTRTESIVCCPGANGATRESIPATVDVQSPISVRKCRAYQSAVNETQRVPTFGGAYKDAQVRVCNMKAMPFIVAGEDASPGEFPHMAIFEYTGRKKIWICAGSLISESFVLTAAHCITSVRYGAPTSVRLGVHSKSGLDINQPDRSQSLKIAATYPHPDYKPTISMYNDIGLVRLQQPVRLSPYIRPACLPETNDEDVSGQVVVVSGWGHTSSGGKFSDRLQKVRLEFFSVTDCNETYKTILQYPRGVDASTQLCAGSRSDSRDSCQGDSGGPLQIEHPDPALYCMHQLLGLASSGIGCRINNTPSIYTRITAFLPWIEHIVWPQD